MKTVLLTGANGCIGSQSIQFLIERGFIVHAVTSKKRFPNTLENLHWHQANLLDTKQIQKLTQQVKATHLLHFAWYFERDVYTSLENFSWVNASFALLENFVKNGGQRVVCAGTCAEYAWTEKIYREYESPLKSQSSYGKCKTAWQILFEAYSERCEISAAWGRIFFLYGFREHPNRLIPSVILHLLRNEPALCSHGNQIRDYLFAEDVADAFVKLLDSNVGGAVNIGSGIPVTLKKLILKTAEITGNRDLVKFGAINAAPNEPPQIVADVKRLQSEVGWKPKWSHDEGLAKTVEWWRENI